jgi:hypothetical protein
MYIIFNPYPVFSDLHQLVFVMAGLNLRFITRHIEGQSLLIFWIFFSGINTFFMWLVWLDRFSGNPNFLFF